ncbi:MAG: thioesterase family protein [Bacteroidota bacterium]|nr:thioesterase family protein [Bacteroidota bacterium]
MARIKLEIPAQIAFSTLIPVRISDLNYGNHLANHVYLEMMQEARMQFLAQFGYSEKNLAGVGVIMGDTAIVYKQECFYGDVLRIEVCAADFGVRSFDLLYRFSKADNSLVCEAKTGMVCFDYHLRKTVAVPQEFIEKCK